MYEIQIHLNQTFCVVFVVVVVVVKATMLASPNCLKFFVLLFKNLSV